MIKEDQNKTQVCGNNVLVKYSIGHRHQNVMCRNIALGVMHFGRPRLENPCLALGRVDSWCCCPSTSKEVRSSSSGNAI